MKRYFTIMASSLLIASCTQYSSRIEKDYIKNLEEKNKALGIANRLKQYMVVNTLNNTVKWPYWSVDLDIAEDTGHAYITMEFVREVYKSGIAFTYNDLQRISNTLQTYVFPSENYFAATIDNVGASDPKDYMFAAAYFPYAAVNSNLIGRIRSLTTVNTRSSFSSGGFYSLLNSLDYRAESRPAGAVCVVDDQCATGSCFAGRICGVPLVNGGTCHKHSDCSSGYCSNTICADRP
jgi:hypothetical protein